ncbi:hypothetical protein T492DRAFT_14033, partial [Pavlovales sp. CCMP2436]
GVAIWRCSSGRAPTAACGLGALPRLQLVAANWRCSSTYVLTVARGTRTSTSMQPVVATWLCYSGQMPANALTRHGPCISRSKELAQNGTLVSSNEKPCPSRAAVRKYVPSMILRRSSSGCERTAVVYYKVGILDKKDINLKNGWFTNTNGVATTGSGNTLA